MCDSKTNFRALTANLENWLRIRLRSLLVYVVKFKFLIDKSVFFFYLDETTQINSRLSEYSFENVLNLLVV